MKLIVFLVMVISPAVLLGMDILTESEESEIIELAKLPGIEDKVLVKWGTDEISHEELIITSEMIDRWSTLDLEIAESQLKQAREKSDPALILQELSRTAKVAVKGGNYSRALACITEALQMKPSFTYNFIAEAGECLFHLSKPAYGLNINNNETVALELYAIFYSYCRSSSTPMFNVHALKNYIELVLSSEDLNPSYEGWSLLKYCRYLTTLFHYQNCKGRLLELINHLSQSGAVNEVFQIDEEIPVALHCFSLKGGGKPPVKGETNNFNYFEVFSNNTGGAGPRGIGFMGKNGFGNITEIYDIDPNPHQNRAYNKKQPKFYKSAAKQFQSHFLANNNNEPDGFTFNFGGQAYTASKRF